MQNSGSTTPRILEAGQWPPLSYFLAKRPTPIFVNAPLIQSNSLGSEGIDLSRLINTLEIPNLTAFGKFSSRLRYQAFVEPIPTMGGLSPNSLRYYSTHHNYGLSRLSDYYVVGCLYEPQQPADHTELYLNLATFHKHFKQDTYLQLLIDAFDEAKIDPWLFYNYKAYKKIPLPVELLPAKQSLYDKLSLRLDTTLLEMFSHQLDLNGLFQIGKRVLTTPFPWGVKQDLEVGWIVFPAPVRYVGPKTNEAVNIYGFHTISMTNLGQWEALMTYPEVRQGITQACKSPCRNTAWYSPTWGSSINASTHGQTLFYKKVESRVLPFLEYVAARTSGPVFLSTVKERIALYGDPLYQVKVAADCLNYEYALTILGAILSCLYVALTTVQPKWVLWWEETDPFGYEVSPFTRQEFKDPKYSLLYEVIYKCSADSPRIWLVAYLKLISFQTYIPPMWISILLLKAVPFFTVFLVAVLAFLKTFISFSYSPQWFHGFKNCYALIKVLFFCLNVLLTLLFKCPVYAVKGGLFLLSKFCYFSVHFKISYWCFWCASWWPPFLAVKRLDKFNKYSVNLPQPLPYRFYKNFFQKKKLYYLLICISPLVCNSFVAPEPWLPKFLVVTLVSGVSLYWCIFNSLAFIILWNPWGGGVHPIFYVAFPPLRIFTARQRQRHNCIWYSRPTEYYRMDGYDPWLPLTIFHRINYNWSRVWYWYFFFNKPYRFLLSFVCFGLFNINVQGTIGAYYTLPPFMFFM